MGLRPGLLGQVERMPVCDMMERDLILCLLRGSRAIIGMETIRRHLYMGIGLILTGLGIAAAFIPLLPTTGFLIAAVYFFARSSPRLERWILEHDVFGPPVVAWRDHGAIPKRAKLLAFAGMTFGFLCFVYFAQPGLRLFLFGFSVILSSAIYVGTRPDGPHSEEESG